ncbi:tetratricopeptide repeat protein [Solimonas sp. SE-A11]|uniref:tetratricopeptide repeat protein n=1 Tax=Solimonas sp. SE-A11 TaxID=3054954 RepID=UPI00259D0B98|nr:tetratricopeptide repeat protein [Solimonas sp. SE-A11]MDM4770076.1 tetratricopeptide repeat protein [Solimonas sp. SE-A11]
MPLRVLLLSLTALVLSACATPPGKHERSYPQQPGSRPGTPTAPPRPGLPSEPVPGVPSPLPPAAPEMVPQEPIVVTPPPPSAPRSAEAVSGQAVTSLVRQARSQRAAGQPQQAQASLERALRIEPRNYFVWSAMAQAYLDQKNYDQAESVAQKSNSLARGNVYAELENWKTIRAARAARGDASGAQAAQDRVAALQAAVAGAAP